MKVFNPNYKEFYDNKLTQPSVLNLNFGGLTLPFHFAYLNQCHNQELLRSFLAALEP